jgi:Sensors of blue-light using FAD
MSRLSSQKANLMPFTQLIYCSIPALADEGQNQVLASIMDTAVRLNHRNGITGCLGYSQDWFLQAIEGQGAAVSETYTRIARDQRHSDIRTLLTRETRNTSFPEWSMISVPLGEASAAARGGTPLSPSTTPPLQLLIWLMNLADAIRMKR